jgi:FtsZ-binding cell division protein ZapB
MIAPLLLEENKKFRELRDKNEEMSDEIKSLKDRNKLLGDENKKLKEKLNVIRFMAS